MKELAPLLCLALLLPGQGPADGSSGLAAPSAQAPPATLLLAEVHYHAHRDTEYVTLFNTGAVIADLRGWRLTDGEGSWQLRGWVAPGSSVVVAQNATALWEDADVAADACLEGCPRRLTREGRFALNNHGDQVLLLDRGGRVVDALRYGTAEPVEGWEGDPAPSVGRGRIARRRGGPQGLLDTDTAGDWIWNRTFRLGQSRHPAGSPMDVQARAIVAGDGALDLLVSLLEGARRRIVLSGFTLTNIQVVEALEAALWRGVRVEVGLEGRPPGGGREGHEALLVRLGEAGGRVLLMEPAPETGFRRYAFHHAKYVVVDGTWILLGSENFSESGFPVTGRGNRGWSLLVQSPALASALLGLAEEDWNASRSDVRVRFEGRWGREKGPSGPSATLAGSWVAAEARLLLSPDNALSSHGLPRLLHDARVSLDVELFYLRQEWRGMRNPLVEQLVEAARRGVRVRLLLDGSPYNLDEGDDNDEAARRLNAIAGAEGLALEARLLSPHLPEGGKLHNKGLIVDDREVWISSMNWNYHGAYENRETGLHVVSSRLASTYREAFEADWGQGAAPVVEDPPSTDGPPPVRVPLAIASAAAALLWFRMLRMGEERTNKRPQMKRRAGATAHRRGGD